MVCDGETEEQSRPIHDPPASVLQQDQGTPLQENDPKVGWATDCYDVERFLTSLRLRLLRFVPWQPLCEANTPN